MSFPDPLLPHKAVEDDVVAQYFAHYIESLAPWYDLNAHGDPFGIRIPLEALSNPLLFSAIIAFAASHLSKTSQQSASTAASFYHGKCVSMLIDLADEESTSRDGQVLAAICLLRSYEILVGQLHSYSTPDKAPSNVLRGQ